MSDDAIRGEDMLVSGPTPFETPNADLIERSSRGDEVSPLAYQHLVETRPWVLLISILGFIGAGFSMLAAVGMLIVGMMGGLGGGPESPDGPFQVGLLGAVVYAGVAVLYALPCIYLFGFAGAIDSLKRGGGMAALEDALLRQKRFWRLVGIFALVSLGLFGLAFVGGILAAVFAGMSA